MTFFWLFVIFWVGLTNYPDIHLMSPSLLKIFIIPIICIYLLILYFHNLTRRAGNIFLLTSTQNIILNMEMEQRFLGKLNICIKGIGYKTILYSRHIVQQLTALCVNFDRKAADPNSGGLQIRERFLNLALLLISFPTWGASFLWEKYHFWYLIHQVIKIS